MTSELTARTVIFAGPQQVETRDLPVRRPEGHALVETLASGISAGTEMNVYRGLAPQWSKRRDARSGLFLETNTPDWSYPTPYGYACVGRVIEGTTLLKPGTLVFTYTPHAAYSVVAESDAVILEPSTDPDIAVVLSNLNTALNGVLDARPPIGSHVVVSGLGVIGQIVVRLLAGAGMSSIIGVDGVPMRRELALVGGATHVIDPTEQSTAEAVRDVVPRGADVVIEASGASPALNEAIRAVGTEGLVLVLSWYGGSFETLNLAGEFHHNRVRIRSSQVGSVDPALGPGWNLERRMDLARAYLASLDLAPLITHRFHVDDAKAAYELLDSAVGNAMQCVLTYGANRSGPTTP